MKQSRKKHSPAFNGHPVVPDCPRLPLPLLLPFYPNLFRLTFTLLRMVVEPIPHIFIHYQLFDKHYLPGIALNLELSRRALRIFLGAEFPLEFVFFLLRHRVSSQEYLVVPGNPPDS